MRNRIYILTILALGFVLSANAQKPEFVTVYDKDCKACQDLLNKTYQDDEVKKKLSELDHQMYEANSVIGRSLIERYSISALPAQFFPEYTSSSQVHVREGFLDVEEQLILLENALLAEKDRSFYKMVKKDGTGLSYRLEYWICASYPDDDFLEELARRLDHEKIPYENVLKYLSDNQNKIKCSQNNSFTLLRKRYSLFKYAMIKGGGDDGFLDGLIRHDTLGIFDYNKREKFADGMQESLLEFSDYLLYGYNADAAGMRVVSSLRQINRLNEFLRGRVDNYPLFDYKKLSEDELKRYRLRPTIFKNKKIIEAGGSWALPFEHYSDPSASLAPYKLAIDSLGYLERYGFIDKTGSIVIPLKYSNAKPFNGGWAAVEKPLTKEDVEGDDLKSKGYQFQLAMGGGAGSGNWGIIDEEGNLVVPFIYKDIMTFSKARENGAVAAVREQGYKGGCYSINRKGEYIEEMHCEWVSH